MGRKPGEVAPRTVVPTQCVARILPTPTEQLHAPSHRSVHENALLLIPDGIRSHGEGGHGCIDEGIRRAHADAVRKRATAGFGIREKLGQLA